LQTTIAGGNRKQKKSRGTKRKVQKLRGNPKRRQKTDKEMGRG
jgi:hypothetical protein